MFSRSLNLFAKELKHLRASNVLRAQISRRPPVSRSGPNCDCNGEMEGLGCGCSSRFFSTFNSKDSTIYKIVLNELDQIASNKDKIDIGISSPAPLKLELSTEPEKLSVKPDIINEVVTTESAPVVDDNIGILEYVENIFKKAKADQKAMESSDSH